jgi:hypothetical protein
MRYQPLSEILCIGVCSAMNNKTRVRVPGKSGEGTKSHRVECGVCTLKASTVKPCPTGGEMRCDKCRKNGVHKHSSSTTSLTALSRTIDTDTRSSNDSISAPSLCKECTPTPVGDKHGSAMHRYRKNISDICKKCHDKRHAETMRRYRLAKKASKNYASRKHIYATISKHRCITSLYPVSKRYVKIHYVFHSCAWS